MNYLTEPLSISHNREDFHCGTELLDRYFKFQAKQDVKRKLSACFVYLDENKQLTIGYYTLSSSSLPKNIIPKSFSKRFPNSYSLIPMILLGRIAIDKNYQAKGIGKLLLIDALKRCNETSDSIGAFAVVVDPIDVYASAFYSKFGFIELPDSQKMYLPMRTIKALFE